MVADGQQTLLTAKAITEATTEPDHEKLEEIEIIFGQFEGIDHGALRRCRNLHSLTLINCKIRQIEHLEAVGPSLVHLCLTNQCIHKIEGLTALLNLRVLYLQQNQIQKIEGLNNCRKLQKLWLFGNQISVIENLSCCSDLRELWLQNNCIRSLESPDGTGIADLVNLQSLNLANNLIRNIDEFQHLRKLIALRTLSFSDEHFGTTPIINHPDYRSYAIATLKQLNKLDGTPIEPSERTNAEDLFFTQSLEFNDKIAELTLAYERELRAIHSRKERSESNAEMLQTELIEALNELERCVVDGQQQIQQEKRRQIQLRLENTKLFQENVETLKKEFTALIDGKIQKETRALLKEERMYEILEQEALAEQNLVTTISTLQCTFPTTIAFQELPDHSPDYRYIATHFGAKVGEGEHDENDKENAENVRILQIYRYFHRDLTARFTADQHHQEVNNTWNHVGEGSELYLYLVANEDEILTMLQSGILSLQATNDSIEEWVFLFSNPMDAVMFYPGTVGEVVSLEGEVDVHEPDVPRIRTFTYLLCQVRMHQTMELSHPEDRKLTTLNALHSIAASSGSILHPSPSTFLQLNLGGASSVGGQVYMARKTTVMNQILPQFLILCSKREFELSTRKVGEEDDDADPVGVLNEFQRALQDEVTAFHTRLYHEIDPSTVRAYTQLQQDKRTLKAQLQHTYQRINREKRRQDELLQHLRSKH